MRSYRRGAVYALGSLIILLVFCACSRVESGLPQAHEASDASAATSPSTSVSDTEPSNVVITDNATDNAVYSDVAIAANKMIYAAIDQVAVRICRLENIVFGAIKCDGSLWVWEDDLPWSNLRGITASIDNPLHLMDDVVYATGGQYHSLALQRDGSLWGWDAITFTLVNGEWETVAPQQVSDTPQLLLTDVTKVLAGRTFTYALKNDGTLWSWGASDNGMLGHGDLQVVDEPHLLLSGVRDMDYGMALLSDTSLWVWGTEDSRATGANIPVKKMDGIQAMGNSFYQGSTYSSAYAIDNEDALWMWGYGSFGALGNGSAEELYRSEPSRVLEGVRSVLLRSDSSYAITTNGDLYAWGRNHRGQIGDGDTTDRLTPYLVMSQVQCLQVLDVYHCVALKDDATLWAWGLFKYPVGLNEQRVYVADISMPQQILDGVVAIATGDSQYQALALKDDGTLFSWGMLDVAGSEVVVVGLFSANPLPVMHDVVAFGTAGFRGAYAITAAGELFTWDSRGFESIAAYTPGDDEPEMFRNIVRETYAAPRKVIDGLR